MIPRNSRKLWALALGLVVAGAAARDAAAGAMTYSTQGAVTAPTGVAASPVFFDGTTGTVPDSGPLNLGNLVVSTLQATNPVNFSNDPFNVVVYSGDQGAKLDGVINSLPNGQLTATFNQVSQFGANPLPYAINVPLNSAFNLSPTNGATSAQTSLSFPITPVPEPASVVVFAAALGGLGLWRRRAAR